jgi:hypothetical protein
LPVLRFDLVPTVLLIVALILVARRPFWFGVVVGVGFMVKLWPIFALLVQSSRRRFLVALAGVAVVTFFSFAAAAYFFGDQSGFFENQAHRGLGVEAVGATPWQLRETITGKAVPFELHDGAAEVHGSRAHAVVGFLRVATVLAVLVMGGWFLVRDRLIHRHGRADLGEVALGRDAVFTATLLAVVTSPVLSPQFLLWTIGVAAIVLGSPGSRMRRPAMVVMAAVLLTFGLDYSSATLVIRNSALVVAAVDACITLFRSFVHEHDAGHVPSSRSSMSRGSADASSSPGADVVPIGERATDLVPDA